MYGTNVYNGYLTGIERDMAIEEAQMENAISRLDTMWEMVNLEYEQNIRDAELKVFSESGTYDDLQFLYEEADKEAGEKKQGILSKLLEFIGSIFNTIGGWFDKLAGANPPPDGPQPEVTVNAVQNMEKATPKITELLNKAKDIVSNPKNYMGKVFAGLAIGGILTSIVEAIGIGNSLSPEEIKEMTEKGNAPNCLDKFKAWYKSNDKKSFVRTSEQMTNLYKGYRNTFNEIQQAWNSTAKAVKDAEAGTPGTDNSTSSNTTTTQPKPADGQATNTKTDTNGGTPVTSSAYDILTGNSFFEAADPNNPEVINLVKQLKDKGITPPNDSGFATTDEFISKLKEMLNSQPAQPAGDTSGKSGETKPAEGTSDAQKPAEDASDKSGETKPAEGTSDAQKPAGDTSGKSDEAKPKSKVLELARLILKLVKDLFLLPFRFVTTKLMEIFKIDAKLEDEENMDGDESGDGDTSGDGSDNGEANGNESDSGEANKNESAEDIGALIESGDISQKCTINELANYCKGKTSDNELNDKIKKVLNVPISGLYNLQSACLNSKVTNQFINITSPTVNASKQAVGKRFTSPKDIADARMTLECMAELARGTNRDLISGKTPQAGDTVSIKLKDLQYRDVFEEIANDYEKFDLNDLYTESSLADDINELASLFEAL